MLPDLAPSWPELTSLLWSSGSMAATFTPEEKFDLITRNLQEVLGGEQIKTILADESRTLKCYWGPSGRRCRAPALLLLACC